MLATKFMKHVQQRLQRDCDAAKLHLSSNSLVGGEIYAEKRRDVSALVIIFHFRSRARTSG